MNEEKELKLASEKIQMALSSLIREVPFYAVQAMRLPLVPSNETKAMSTNGKRIRYNPKWVLDNPLSLVETVICHEIEHINLRHHLRRDNRDIEEWNEAADYSTNWILRQARFNLGNLLYDEKFDNMSAEQIHFLMYSKRKEQPGDNDEQENSQDQQQESISEDSNNGSDDSGETEDNGNADRKSSTEEDAGDSGQSDGSEESSSSGSGDQDSSTSEENESSSEENSSSGTPMSDSEAPGNEGKDSNQSGMGSPCKPSEIGEVEDFPGEAGEPSEAEVQQEEAEIRIGMEQAMRVAMKAGKMPGNFKIIVEQLMKPEVDWREMLAGWVNERSSSDYTMRKPNRRFLHSGFYLPSLYNNELGNLLVIMDSSGSVIGKPQMVRSFVSEILSLATNFNIKKITIVYVDSRVQGFDIIEEEGQEPDLSKLSGGGGTSFCPGFDWMDERIIQGEEEPIGAIYLTDGECSRYPIEPSYPVLWVIAKGGYIQDFKPPWGNIVKLNEW